MQIDPETHGRSLYRTLTGSVVPRPIGWISTTGADGVDNLAPYSYCNIVSVRPPLLMFSPNRVPGEDLKDSARNALDTGEFVHNVVTRDLAERMNETSATLPPGESEFDHADVARAETEKVAPPRVADAKIAFECEVFDHLDVGSATLLLGEVVLVHADDSVTTDGKIDVEKVDAVGRLAGEWYATTDDRFRLERPE
ncbi:MAG: flavin reductase family protein [Halorientalis sp.]